MANETQRPPVRVRFRYNVDTGEIEEFIVDDNAPDRSEDYHNKVARAFAGQLSGNAEIEDAGRIRYRRGVDTDSGLKHDAAADADDARKRLED